MAQVPAGEPGQAAPVAPTHGTDPLGTVGLALLAYGLVQLLSKVVDRLPLGRRAADGIGAEAGFTADDRRRLEEQLALHQRLLGQALDELRVANGKLDRTSRGLRRLWRQARRRTP
jgi:hypothetical protein